MKTVHGFPNLTEDQKMRLEALSKLPDEQIDTSDIPEWTEKDFFDALPFADCYKPRKEQITARIDADILAWLKSQGKGYQTLMNTLLRREMLRQLKKRV